MEAKNTKKETISKVTKLDINCLKTLIEEEPSSIKGKTFILQVLNLKDVEAEKAAQNTGVTQPEKTGKEKMKSIKLK